MKGLTLLTVTIMITIGAVGIDATPGSGTVMIIIGCVLGYIGGLLAPPVTAAPRLRSS
jgi:hypothetical protein